MPATYNMRSVVGFRNVAVTLLVVVPSIWAGLVAVRREASGSPASFGPLLVGAGTSILLLVLCGHLTERSRHFAFTLAGAMGGCAWALVWWLRPSSWVVVGFAIAVSAVATLQVARIPRVNETPASPSWLVAVGVGIGGLGALLLLTVPAGGALIGVEILGIVGMSLAYSAAAATLENGAAMTRCGIEYLGGYLGILVIAIGIMASISA